MYVIAGPSGIPDSFVEWVPFPSLIFKISFMIKIIKFKLDVFGITRKSKDRRIDQTDFLNYAASSTHYSLFSLIWVSDIFHIVGRSNGTQQFALVDFTQLLDPRWKAPGDLITSFLVEVQEEEKLKSASVLNSIAQSMYNFVQRGASGAFGATIIYPIDLHG